MTAIFQALHYIHTYIQITIMEMTMMNVFSKSFVQSFPDKIKEHHFFTKCQKLLAP